MTTVVERQHGVGRPAHAGRDVAVAGDARALWPTVRRGRRVHPEPLVSIVIPTLNRIDLLVRCLESIERNVTGRIPHETIVIANGTSIEELRPLQDRDDVVILRARTNLGFAGGCNWAATHARGAHLVLLNDDAEVHSTWLDHLIATASEPYVGAVGSRVLDEDGTLLESGAVVWSDGSTAGVGRGLPAGSRDFDFVRDVDYTSACSLLISRQAWDAIGGLDERYFPAYYEDVDLCFSLRHAGFRVVVDPRSVVTHTESSSTSPDFAGFLLQRNRREFVKKWSPALRAFVAPPVHRNYDSAIDDAVQRGRGWPARLLVIHDGMSDPGPDNADAMLGAVEELAREYAVTLVRESAGGTAMDSRLAERGVEVITDDPLRHIELSERRYNAVLISHPMHFERYAAAIRSTQPQAGLVYGTTTLWNRRLRREATLISDAEERFAVEAAAADMEKVERRIVALADAVICQSRFDAATAQGWHEPAEIVVVPTPQVQPTTEGFFEREDILLTTGWPATDTPAVDGLRFFVLEVLPLLVAANPGVRLIVAGGAPPRDACAFAGPHVTFLGHVPDIRTAFAAARLVVVPAGFGSSAAAKTLAALMHGVPVVARHVAAEGIDFAGTAPVIIRDGAEGFAAAVTLLMTDPACWSNVRDETRRFASRQRATASTTWTTAIGRGVARAAARSGEPAAFSREG